MEAISVFDIFKVGIGPSSSHTMGPWRASQRFLKLVPPEADRVEVHLYGSLAKTGVGHGTDIAVALGLMGYDPETVDPEIVFSAFRHSKTTGRVGKWSFKVVFHNDECLLGHPNGVRFAAFGEGQLLFVKAYYSVGGGFIVEEGQNSAEGPAVSLPFPINSAAEIHQHEASSGKSLRDIVWENEIAWRTPEEIRSALDRLIHVMIGCVHRGCGRPGVLPGGLEVERRAATLHNTLAGAPPAETAEAWLAQLESLRPTFGDTLNWVSCFALAVNEENASFGRVVTAPTNGAAGVVPAVMLYLRFFADGRDRLHDFILVAGELGSLFKKGATISAAMGGCQAEIGVSSAMAAGALAYCMGADTHRSLMAAEIAMEHHLGLTCDPIGGLVQIPCIERNTMGAMKAITAAHLALNSDPSTAKVSLDDVIETMWRTALDMNTKYKETSEGGLAVQIPVLVPEC